MKSINLLDCISRLFRLLVRFYFNVWYLPSNAAKDFADHLHHFRRRVEPYREFLSPAQQREVFDDVPSQDQERFAKTRRLFVWSMARLPGLFFAFRALTYLASRSRSSLSRPGPWGGGIDWLVRSIVKAFLAEPAKWEQSSRGLIRALPSIAVKPFVQE